MMRATITILATALTLASFAATPEAMAAKRQPQAVACTSITTFNQLQAMQDDLNGVYCLANSINAGSHGEFTPVGGSTGLFTGEFHGNGHSIVNLTINSANSYVGLFGMTDGAVIQDLGLLNVSVTGTGDNASVGSIVGLLDGNGGTSTIARVRVSGRVRCTASNCFPGGIVGSTNGPGMLSKSWSSAAVAGSTYAGGAVGYLSKATLSQVHATGAATCTATNCMAGGLVGRAPQNAAVILSSASGPVTAAGGADSRAGGLIGYTESGTTISLSHASGPVTIGASGMAAGLIGQHNSGGAIDQTYSVGLVSSTGGSTGGLIANSGGGPSITNSYWDTVTSKQSTSPGGGTAMTTVQLRADLPPGFGTAWGITKTLSYPFLKGSAFTAPLATLVNSGKVLVFLPVRQFDDLEYITPPQHAGKASKAAVYTMIARAIGRALNDSRLRNVRIDRYFWDDAAQTTIWRGPVTEFARLSPLTSISESTPLGEANVIGQMDRKKLVILRGTYQRNDGSAAIHWMLGTLYTQASDGSVISVIANDPWTGVQVAINPKTKMARRRSGILLSSFKVTDFQSVTLDLSP